MRLVVAAFLFCAGLVHAQEVLMDPIIQSGWRAALLHNSPGKFYKDETGRVHLSGLIWKFGEVNPQGESVMVLPVGYRPSNPEWFMVFSQHGSAPVVVFESGVIQVFAQSSPISQYNDMQFTMVSMSGISFLATQ